MYTCIDCGKDVTARSERCSKCSHIKNARLRVKIRDMKNEKNPNYKNGQYSNNIPKCLHCNKKITTKKSKNKLCIRCFNKARKNDKHPNFKGGLPRCIDCGKKLSTRGNKYYKPIKCRKCYLKGGMKVRHHIDLNEQNNKTKNLLYISQRTHVYLHRKSYEYILEKNLIKKYLSWFNNKYGLK